MQHTFEFNSQYHTGAELKHFDEQSIRSEPMLHKCSRSFACEHGGPITIRFIGALPESWFQDSSLLIDSRTHMLMPGWFPCIPGWHHDDVPRERSDGQPNYVNPSYRSKHCMAIFGDASVTEFAIGQATFPEVPLGGVYYREWHPKVEEYITTGILKRERVPQATQVFFNWQSWHQGTAATKNGWRLFIRASIGGTRKPANEIRHQTQIYMGNPYAGW